MVSQKEKELIQQDQESKRALMKLKNSFRERKPKQQIKKIIYEHPSMTPQIKGEVLQILLDFHMDPVIIRQYIGANDDLKIEKRHIRKAKNHYDTKFITQLLQIMKGRNGSLDQDETPLIISLQQNYLDFIENFLNTQNQQKLSQKEKVKLEQFALNQLHLPLIEKVLNMKIKQKETLENNINQEDGKDKLQRVLEEIKQLKKLFILKSFFLFHRKVDDETKFKKVFSSVLDKFGFSNNELFILLNFAIKGKNEQAIQILLQKIPDLRMMGKQKKSIQDLEEEPLRSKILKILQSKQKVRKQAEQKKKQDDDIKRQSQKTKLNEYLRRFFSFKGKKLTPQQQYEMVDLLKKQTHWSLRYLGNLLQMIYK